MTSSANLQWWLFWRGIRVFLETLLIKGFGDQSCWFNLPRLDQMMGFAILIPGCQARQGFKMMALRSSFGAIEDWNYQGAVDRLWRETVLRSSFGAIEDWNRFRDAVDRLHRQCCDRPSGRSRIGTGITQAELPTWVLLRSSFGAIEDWNEIVNWPKTIPDELRSSFGAIEDWNQSDRGSCTAKAMLRSSFGAIEDWNPS